MKNSFCNLMISVLSYHKQLLVITSLVIGLLGDGPPMS
jgi:hypothetical protein